MSKKMLKRSLALGVLMAFVITGSAMAEQLNGNNKEYIGLYDSVTGAGNNVTIEGTNIETVTFTGSTTGYTNGAFRADNTTGSVLKNVDTIIVKNGWDNVFLTNGSGVMNIEKVNNIISVETTSNAPYRVRFFHALGGTLNVGTQQNGIGRIELKNVGNAFYAQTVNGKNGVINVNAQSIYIDSYGGAVIGAVDFNDASANNKSSVSITADDVTIKAIDGTALSAISGTIRQEGNKWITDTDSEGINHEDNSITITSDTLNIEAKDVVVAKNGSTNGVSVSLNSKNIVLKAENDAVLAKDMAKVNIGGSDGFVKAEITGNITSSEQSAVDVSLGEDGSFTGAINTGGENGDNSSTTLDLGTNSTWTATGDSNVTTVSGDGNIKVDMTKAGTIATVAITNALSDNDSIEVSGTGDVSDYLAANGKTAEEALAKSVTAGSNNTPVDTEITTEEGMTGGAYTLRITEDGVQATQTVNTKSDAVSDAGMTLKGHWRAHMNDMNKRMGELRMANGEHGVWTRMVRGESEYQGAKMQYNQYQLGYDEKLSVDKRWTVGAAVTFSEGDSSYGSGSTDDKSTAFAIYGSKLNNDGTFVDLIARYAHLESDLDDRNYGTGDYSTNGMSVSAEFGKRIQQGNGLWIEPQVEFTYGTVDSADVAFSKAYKAHYDSMDSFIARAGFALGKDIKQGNVYARASYLYDFDGETETQFEGGKAISEDFGGGWWEVGVGANINLSKATYIYADIEKTFGGEVDTNWQWNLGVRYSF